MAFFSFPDQVLTAGRGYRRPGQFFDLPSAMALGADPQLAAGYGGELPPLVFRQPGPIQQELKPAPAPELKLPPIGMTPADLPPIAPRAETPQGRSITFTTPGGVETARYGADNKFLGGDIRGNVYATLQDRPNAMARLGAQDGLNETGIPGVPSVRSIMENQLFGMNMDPDRKRLLAAGMQEKYMNPLAALERDRLQGQFGVQEAEARRREMLNAQQSQIMQYEMMKFEEANPRATMEDKLRHRDMVAKTRGITIPGSSGDAGEMVGPVRPVDPIQQALSNNSFKRLEDIFSAGRGPRGEALPFTPTEESASALMSALASAPDADRSKLVERAIALSAGSPEMLKMVARNMARNYMLSSGTRLNRADMMVDAATSGLPFDIRTTGAKGYAALGGVPSVAVLPNNVNIPLHYRDKPSEYSRLGVSGVDRQRIAQENEAAKNFLLAAIQQGLLTR